MRKVPGNRIFGVECCGLGAKCWFSGVNRGSNEVADRTLIVTWTAQNRRFDGKSLFYSSTYTRDGSDVRVERRVVKNYGKSVCGSVEWEELKVFQEEIRRDLRAQFVY